MKKLLLLILLALPMSVLAQCKYISMNTTTVDDQVVNKKEIPVYLNSDKVPGEYIEIGLIVCEINRDKAAFRKAKKKAAKNGATAIYLLNEKNRTGMDKALNALLGTFHKDEMKFIAVQHEYVNE